MAGVDALKNLARMCISKMEKSCVTPIKVAVVHTVPSTNFKVIIRNSDHPVTKDMPPVWLHAKDELYSFLRGPGEKMTVLATSPSKKSKRQEPMIFTIDYGKGRVFHTPMGHADYSMKCVGFIVTLQRGTEWAATGKVTQKIPDDFPSADKSSSRKFK